MKLVSLKNIGLVLVTKELFHDLNFVVSQDSKIGLIGYNGSGKSSLLKVIDKTIKPDEGEIVLSKNTLVARVEQDFPENLLKYTLQEAVLDKLNDDDKQYNFWKVDNILTELGFLYEDTLKNVDELSGGQYNRGLIARALIQEPDFLLLDEPSNHMDLPTILWLENFLKNWSGGFILVSHDKTLLDNITHETLVLRDKRIYHFNAPYTKAQKLLEKFDEDSKNALISENREIERIESNLKILASRGSKKTARQVKSKEKGLEKLKAVRTFVSNDSASDIIIKGKMLSAKESIRVMSTDILDIGETRTLYKIKSTLSIKPTDKIALIGYNGSGKSTLLYWLYKNFKGNNEFFKYHEKLQLSYYDQNNTRIENNIDIIDSITNKIEVNDANKIRKALMDAGFPADIHKQKTNILSGGQRARLNMLLISLEEPHFILFDEPTNHLDMDGKESLINSLKEYDGGYVMVSHDRHFLAKTCNRFLYINNNTLLEELALEKIYKAIGVN